MQYPLPDVKYCRQRNETRLLRRGFNQSCYNNGQLWTFKKLFEHNISSLEVLKWSSSIEQADQYAKYLSNHSLDGEDHYICNRRGARESWYRPS